MSKDLVFVEEQDTIQAAARLMAEANVGFLPVCDDHGRPVGTLTDRDIAIRVAAGDRSPAEVAVGEVMTRDVIACKPDDDIEDAQQVMADQRVSRLLVTDNGGVLRGVISLSDLPRSTEQTFETYEEITEREIYPE